MQIAPGSLNAPSLGRITPMLLICRDFRPSRWITPEKRARLRRSTLSPDSCREQPIAPAIRYRVPKRPWRRLTEKGLVGGGSDMLFHVPWRCHDQHRSEERRVG